MNVASTDVRKLLVQNGCFTCTRFQELASFLVENGSFWAGGYLSRDWSIEEACGDCPSTELLSKLRDSGRTTST